MIKCTIRVIEAHRLYVDLLLSRIKKKTSIWEAFVKHSQCERKFVAVKVNWLKAPLWVASVRLHIINTVRNVEHFLFLVSAGVFLFHCPGPNNFLLSALSHGHSNDCMRILRLALLLLWLRRPCSPPPQHPTTLPPQHPTTPTPTLKNRIIGIN